MNRPTGQHANELQQAFEQFNRMSRVLADSYHELEGQVARLTSELAAARRETVRQLGETQRLASRMQNLLETLPAGVVVLDGDGCIEAFNPAAADLLEEPLKNQLWDDVSDRSFVPGVTDGGEVSLRDGRRVSISRRPLTKESGTLVLLTDVTQARQLQAMLDRERRLSSMGEVAAKLAHEIRTPLSTAVLYASQLSDSQLSVAHRERFSARVVSRLQDMEQMVNDMLSFARGEQMGDDEVRIAELIEEVRQGLEPQLAARGNARVDITGDFDETTLRGNRQALVSALSNVSANGIQVSPPGSTLRIHVERTASHMATIRIEDQGPGIPEPLRERVFEPFFSTRENGTGLGLAIVRSVVKAHNGEIAISDGEHGGTCIILRFPVSGAGHALPSGCGASESGGSWID